MRFSMSSPFKFHLQYTDYLKIQFTFSECTANTVCTFAVRIFNRGGPDPSGQSRRRDQKNVCAIFRTWYFLAAPLPGYNRCVSAKMDGMLIILSPASRTLRFPLRP